MLICPVYLSTLLAILFFHLISHFEYTSTFYLAIQSQCLKATKDLQCPLIHQSQLLSDLYQDLIAMFQDYWTTELETTAFWQLCCSQECHMQYVNAHVNQVQWWIWCDQNLDDPWKDSKLSKWLDAGVILKRY